MLEVCRIPARWQGYLLSGVIFLILGIICLFLTRQVMGIMLVLFSAIAILIGILLVVASVFVIGFRMHWAPLLLSGVIFIIIGLFSIYYPEIVTAVAIYLIAGLSILVGILMVVYGAISFVEMKTRLLVVILGVIPIFIGGFMIFNPSSAAALVIQLWGIFACILGIVLIVQGLILRRVNRELGCSEEDS